MPEKPLPFPIVGIGASAGGIEALEHFFRALPNQAGMAFVIVTHLSPERVSVLHEIVARYTDMVVEPARDGVELTPNRVFVLPENAIIGIEKGHIRLSRPDPARRERKPVDIFLSALAKDQGENAVGIILSGGDSDGTLGVKAIKECGGLTMAQVHDGGGPRHPSMPDSAIASGMVDFALPVDEMPEKLIRFAKALAAQGDNGQPRGEAAEDSLAEVYALLRSQIGHDFSGYKTKTFGRRVHRRMQVNDLVTVQAYVEKLRTEPAEVAALFRDLLINVTTFFRDKEAFASLARDVIPRLFDQRGVDDTVRVWVPGCATGEEVYSIAILLREHLDTLKVHPRVQIFATDIDERSLSAARAARYPEPLMDSVSPARRNRFFVADGDSYVVAKDIRELCIFSPHSVIRDPPFSRIDLVSCRNLLIYFGPQIQGQVLPIFHYALRPGGFLFLGLSENVTQFSELFAPLDKKSRIFRARADGSSDVRVPISLFGAKGSGASFDSLRLRKPSTQVSLRNSVESQVMEQFAPPHVAVNAEGDVVYYSGRTGKYLEAAAGAPSRHLLGMVRKGLSLELRGALRQAVEAQSRVTRENVAIDVDEDRVQLVNLTVSPMQERDGEPLFLVLFADVGPALSRKDAGSRAYGESEDIVGYLETELRDVRERLQSMIEEYETALEELKSSNEELVSVNEELQSTNEELESSKEELQSLNEELQTVNLELSHKVDALDQSNADLRNLFKSTQVATLFLDPDMVIRNFTPPAEDLFNLVPTDRGRLLTSFSNRLDYPALFDDIRKTLETRQLIEQPVRGIDGHAHYLARLRPYDGSLGETKGVVLTFVDVTSLNDAEAQQRKLIAELNHRVKNMLSVVVGIARQTSKGTTAVKPFTDALIGRLQSMARSYELLSTHNWTTTTIHDVASAELAPFGPERTKMSGPEIALKPKQALSFGMIFHELTTNAAAHGALSTPGGWIDIAWVQSADADPRRLHLTWQEHGGPTLAEAGSANFGLKLVERETAYTLDGQAGFEWNPSGLRVTLEIRTL